MRLSQQRAFEGVLANAAILIVVAEQAAAAAWNVVAQAFEDRLSGALFPVGPATRSS